MPGEWAKSGTLIYFATLGTHGLRDGLLRLIDHRLDFGFVRARVRPQHATFSKTCPEPDQGAP